MKKNSIIILIVVLALAITGCTTTITETPVENETAVEAEAAEVSDEEAAVGEANIVHLTDANYHEVIDNTEGVAIVDFWATWCPPCVELGPILEEISAEEGITVYKVDVDENPAIAREFMIQSIPMVYIYNDGEVVDSQLGLGTKKLYLAKIEPYQ